MTQSHQQANYQELEQAVSLIQATVKILRQTRQEVSPEDWQRLREARSLLGEALPLVEQVAARRTAGDPTFGERS